MEDIKTEERFNHLLKKHEKVFVDIYTSFCGPCKKLLPSLEELSKKYPKIMFCKINAQSLSFITEGDSEKLMEPITGVPTLIFFIEGKEKARISGSSISAIQDMIEKNA